MYKNALHFYVLVINTNQIEEILFTAASKVYIAMVKPNKMYALHKDKIITLIEHRQ